jgi:hypothetical protein
MGQVDLENGGQDPLTLEQVVELTENGYVVDRLPDTKQPYSFRWDLYGAGGYQHSAKAAWLKARKHFRETGGLGPKPRS